MASSTTAPPVPDAVAPPQGNPRFPQLDGLRGIAALSVVVFHADQFTHAQGTFLGCAASHLDVGVTVFFVLTGFLLYRPYYAAAVADAPRFSPSLFYWRRIVRIVPAYWFALIALFPLLTYAHPAGLANFLFIQTYRASWARTGIAPGWSVCIEISFYALLPIYAAALSRVWKHLSHASRRRRELCLLLLMTVASLTFRVALEHTAASVYYRDLLPGTFAWFSIGMTMAVLSVGAGRRTDAIRQFAMSRPWACWLLALVIYASTLTSRQGGIETGGVSMFIRYMLIAALLFAPLAFSSQAAVGPASVLSSRVLMWLGLVSYGIYLYHYPIMSHLHRLGFIALVISGAAIAVLCGAASYYLLERPLLRFKRISQIDVLPVLARLVTPRAD